MENNNWKHQKCDVVSGITHKFSPIEQILLKDYLPLFIRAHRATSLALLLGNVCHVLIAVWISWNYFFLDDLKDENMKNDIQIARDSINFRKSSSKKSKPQNFNDIDTQVYIEDSSFTVSIPTTETQKVIETSKSKIVKNWKTNIDGIDWYNVNLIKKKRM